MSAAIHVVTDPGVPVFGTKGASVHAREVLRELTRRHDVVHLITTRPGPETPGVVQHPVLRAGGDPAAREAAQRDVDAAAGRLVAELCDREPVALVYVRYALWCAAPLEAATAPTVLEINSPLVDEQATYRGLADADGAVAYTRRALAAADAPFAVSAAVAAWASGLDPRGRDVAVVANGVDVERFTPGPARRHDGPSTTVVFTGTFKPWHGTDLLVDAVAAVRARGVAMGLLLVGDGPHLAATVERAAAAGVPAEASGAVDPAEVPRWLRRADVAVAPYPAGAHWFSPLKLAEYLAAGLPPVAASIADVGELVVDDVEALLVPPGSTEALAAALHRLATDPALRERLGVAGRAAAERMSWTATLDATLALLPAGDRP